MDETDHFVPVDTKKKNTNRSANTKITESGRGPLQSQSVKYTGKSSDTLANKQNNEVSNSVTSRRPESVQESQKAYASSSDDRSTRKDKRNNRESTSLAHKTNKSASSASFQNRSSESSNPREATNSQRHPSGMQKQKHSADTDFVRKSEDSTNTSRKNSSRNFNTVKHQEKNTPFRNTDDGGDYIGKVNGPASNKKESRDENYLAQTSGGKKQMGFVAEKQNKTDTGNQKDSTKNDDAKQAQEFLLSLKENKIKYLIKKNPRFPKANYFCTLCDFHLNIEVECSKHMKEARHLRRKKLHEEDTLLRSIPKPTERQYTALTAAVEKVYTEYGISVEEKQQRADAVVRLEKVLKETIPDLVLYMYGSSLTGFGMKTADINVNLTSTDKNKKLTTLLKETYAAIKDQNDSGFSNVRPDFTAKVPGLYLTDDVTGLTLSIAIHCYKAHCSSQLLSMYSDFDIRVSKLAVAFRYWAHLCQLDRHLDGFIPPQAFNLMVIYFLQQMSPQLVPIIKPPEVTEDETGDYEKDAPTFEKMRAKVMKSSSQNRNTMSVGELWFRLLRFYCLDFDTPNTVVCIRSNQPVPRNTKPWNSKRLAVEDPYMLKKNIAGMVNHAHVCEYWEDCIRHALHYFGFPRDAEGRSHIPIDAFMKMIQHSEMSAEVTGQDEAVKPSTVSGGSVPTSKNDETQKPQYSESSRQEAQTRDNQSMSESRSDDTKNSDPEDDDDYEDSDGTAEDQQSSVSGNLHDQSSAVFPTDSNSQMTLSALSDQRNHSAKFLENQNFKQNTSHAGMNKGISQTPDNDHISQQAQRSANTSTGANQHQVASHITRDKPAFASSKDSKDVDPENDSQIESSSHNSQTLSLSSSSLAAADDAIDHSKLTEAMNDIFLLLEQKDCHYDFIKEYLTDGKGPVLVCAYCDKVGHLKNACPDDKLPEIFPLPPLTMFHIKILSETLNRLPAMVGLSSFGSSSRIQFLKELEAFIRFHFDDANLTLFGSSCNGFGFEKSDMDICLTFSHRKVNDKPWVIESLARRMKQWKELINVQAISTAKVPIVKFTVRSLGLEGDISLYNILAQHNTRLLLCYSQIDPRVQILGCTIKNFAKVCDIGDASRGSLSSYGYILLMIYYLQQVSPPVVPVLQELYEGKEKPQVIVEECNVWFMGDLKKLNTLWPDKGKNKMSVAELWIGFLRFYVEEFNYKEIVVSIRQKEPVTRFDKLWNGESIAIEDPFDHSHNLGSGLTRNMNNFIFKTFINGRMLHGSPVDNNMDRFRNYRKPYDYFFDPELLSESRPPNVRGCHVCGKMGHVARYCPVRKAKEQQNKPQKPFQLQNKQQMQPQQKQGVVSPEQTEAYKLLSRQDNQQKQRQASQLHQKQEVILTQSVQQEKQLLEQQQPHLPSQQRYTSQQLERNNSMQVQQPARQHQHGEPVQPKQPETEESPKQEQQQYNKLLEKQQYQRQPLQPHLEERKQNQPLCEQQQISQPKQLNKIPSSQLQQHQQQQRQPLLHQPVQVVRQQEHQQVQSSHPKPFPQTQQQLQQFSRQPSQTNQQNMQPLQSQKQQQRSPLHQQQQVGQSPQSQQQQRQPFLSQQNHHRPSLEQNFRQPFQPQMRQPAVPQQEKHPFNFQQLLSQQQLQLQNQYPQQHPQSQPQQQYHHSQPQNYPPQQLQQSSKLETYDSEQEQSQSQKSRTGRTSSSPDPAFSRVNHQASAPVMPAPLHSLVFHNTNYMQQRHQVHQNRHQHQLRGYPHNNNPPLLAPATVSQPPILPPPGFNFNFLGNRPLLVNPGMLLPPGYPQPAHALHNPGSAYSTQASHNPESGYSTQASHGPESGYSTQASHSPMSGYPTQASHNPGSGYSTQGSHHPGGGFPPQAPHNPGNGYFHNSGYSKGPQTVASMHHSGHSSGDGSLNGQLMNPTVQNMFDRARQQ